MKKFLIVALLLGVFLVGSAFAIRTITITAWTIGPDIPSVNRFNNLTAAASRLNLMLKTVGSDIRVKVKGFFDTVNWNDYLKKVVFGLQSGQPVDILCTGHDLIAGWAEAGYLIPLDKYIKEYWNSTYSAIIPSLWNAMKYKGKTYGIPQDTEARPVFVNKIALRKLGWTESQIDSLPQKVYDGQFTLSDLIQLAKEAQSKGYVEWGFYHRPVVGVDFFELLNDYGVKFYDPQQQKFIFSKSGMKKVLTFFYDLTNVWKITPTTLIGSPWNSVHKEVTAGKVFAFMGGTWNWAEWQKVWHKTNKELKNMFLPIPLPAVKKGGKPVTLSHPFAYMITKNSKHPEIAALIITLATAPDLNFKHDVASGHLPVAYTEMGYPEYTKNYIMVQGTKMLPFTSFVPNSPDFGYTTQYNAILFNAISAVESGESVDSAEKQMLSRLEGLYPGRVIVEK